MVECPVVAVRTADLVPTQEHVVIARLLALDAGGPCEGPDPYPHIVAWCGRLYVHNGHHRWLRALLRGRRWLLVRVQTPGSTQGTEAS